VRRVACDIVEIERQQTSTILRGYVCRTSSEYEVVLVTAPTTEKDFARLMPPFILRWPQVDIENIQFEQSNVVHAHFLDSARFQVLQANGEPEGYSNFFEETDAFSVVSSLR